MDKRIIKIKEWIKSAWAFIKSKFKELIMVSSVSAATITGGAVVSDRQINPYVDKVDRLEVAMVQSIPESGEAKIEIIKNRPEIRLKKWNGEVNMGVRYDKINAVGKRKFLTNRVEWKGTKEELHTYPLDPKEGMEDGGLEIEIILKEKPLTNKFNFQIDGYQDLEFYYQPPLNIEMASSTCSATRCGGSFRPENVVGSYAVYSKTKVNHQTGQTNYATGKVYHIYRPKIIDANNNWTWGILSYQSGILTVEVPQTFLDTAVYPVIVDPTFGNTSIGGTTSWNLANELQGIHATSPADASTADNIVIYIRRYLSTDKFKGILVDSSLHILTNGITSETSPLASFTWTTSTFVTSPSLSPSTSYRISYITNSEPEVKYDNVPSSSLYDSSNNYITPTDPTDGDDSDYFKISIYVNYTASGGGSPSPPQSIYWFD